VPRSSPDLLADAIWRCAATEPGSVTDPDALETVTEWMTAPVPGTAAGALREAQSDAGRAKPGAASSVSAASVSASDWWFVTTVATTGEGSWLLQFDGVTAFADVWIDGVLVASTESMFTPGEVSIPAGVGVGKRVQVAVHFHSLSATLRSRRPRGRWRSSMVREQGLRWIRTTMLGMAPVFSGAPVPVGPWRGIRLLDRGVATVVSTVKHASVHGTTGRVAVSARLTGLPVSLEYVTVRVGEHSQQFATATGPDGFLEVSGIVEVADAQLWWPHTHGAARTYPVTIETDGVSEHIGSVGFRTVEVDRSDGGFRLSVNGIGVYCRGSVWVPTDPISLQGDADTTLVLERLAEAGLNMIRIPGTMVYESDHFWDECARLGILVWQDMMLATLDPPDTDEFFELVAAEVTPFLRRVRGNPALAVFCGGSETEQQPTMLGLVGQHIPLIHARLPELISTLAPELEYVTSSPSAPPGGEQLATHVGSGVAHYFGVGAYRRPLADVLSARVRFATESLAFSIPPSNAVIENEFGSLAVAGHHPAWKAAVPRDNGSSWDFEDVRDHYVHTLFGEDPREVRWSDPERYLDLGRAAVCEAFASTLGYWRRTDSRCDGALTLALRDLEPGPGWGVLDWSGSPKAPWFVLRRSAKPIALLVTDDGMDGLRLDAINETANPVVGEIRFRAHSRSGVVPVDVALPVKVEAHSSLTWSVDSLVGRFTDLTHVFRFGARTYDAVTVTLEDEDGELVDEVVHLLGGPARPLERSVGLVATARSVGRPRSIGDEEWVVDVTTDAAAQYVALELQGFEPEDSWFHLAPNGRRTVRLRRTGKATKVIGRVRALNSHTSVAVTPPSAPATQSSPAKRTSKKTSARGN